MYFEISIGADWWLKTGICADRWHYHVKSLSIKCTECDLNILMLIIRRQSVYSFNNCQSVEVTSESNKLYHVQLWKLLHRQDQARVNATKGSNLCHLLRDDERADMTGKDCVGMNCNSLSFFNPCFSQICWFLFFLTKVYDDAFVYWTKLWLWNQLCTFSAHIYICIHWLYERICGFTIQCFKWLTPLWMQPPILLTVLVAGNIM